MKTLEVEEIKIPMVGEQIQSHVFKLNRKYYHGRVEEARKHYARYPDIWKQYSFFEYVALNYNEYKKPKNLIKQDIIAICAKDMAPSDITKVLCLINKL